ncbi:MAG: hypothetical protein NC433_09715 [Clostridiales bacterium]|nr:hypothetical protein [Clostridiales bacterium]
MFSFRIIDTPDGNQIIDMNIKTMYDSLTPLQMMEYNAMDNQLYYMERLENKKRKEAERKRLRNPIYKIACLCGLV